MKIKAYRYEDESFSHRLFKPVRNQQDRNKPAGGCWFSPIKVHREEDYQPYGWEEWCEDNGYTEEWLGGKARSEYVVEGKILVIDDKFDPETIRLIDCGPFRYNCHPDYEWLIREGYDAILYTQEGLRRFHHCSRGFDLNGWDLESVLVLNPNAVRAIRPALV